MINETIKFDVEVTGLEELTAGAANARQELRTLTTLINSGELSGKQLDAAINRAAELTDRIGDVNDKIRALASDTRKLDLVVSAFSSIAGGIATAQGALAIFGVENENVEKAILKTQGALTLLNGVQQIATDVTKQGTAANTLYAAAQTGLSAVIGTSTGALKLFRLALIGTGIGIAVVALGALVANWDKLTSAITKNFPFLEKFANTVRKVIQTVTDLLGLTSKESRANDDLAARVENANKKLKERSEILKAQGDELGSLQAESSIIRNNITLLQQQLKLDKDNVTLTEELNSEKQKLRLNEIAIANQGKKATEARKKESDAIAKDNLKQIEDEKKEQAEIIKVQEDAYRRRLDLLETSFIEEENKLLIKRLEGGSEEEYQEEVTKLEEDYYVKRLDNLQNYIDELKIELNKGNINAQAALEKALAERASLENKSLTERLNREKKAIEELEKFRKERSEKFRENIEKDLSFYRTTAIELSALDASFRFNKLLLTEERTVLNQKEKANEEYVNKIEDLYRNLSESIRGSENSFALDPSNLESAKQTLADIRVEFDKNTEAVSRFNEESLNLIQRFIEVNQSLGLEGSDIKRSLSELEQIFLNEQQNLFNKFEDGRIKTQQDLDDNLLKLKLNYTKLSIDLLRGSLDEENAAYELSQDRLIKLLENSGEKINRTQLTNLIQTGDINKLFDKLGLTANQKANAVLADVTSTLTTITGQEGSLTNFVNTYIELLNKFLGDSFDTLTEDLEKRRKSITDAFSLLSGSFSATGDITASLAPVINAISNISLKIKDLAEDGKERVKGIVAMGAQTGLLLSQAFGDLSQTIINRRIESLKTETDIRIAELEKQKQNGIINEEQLNNARIKIQEDYYKKEYEAKKKAFNLDKAAKIASAVAAGALAFVTALPNLPLAGIIAGLTTLQVGIIASQKFPPFTGGSSSTSPSPPPSISGGSPSIPRFNVNTGQIEGTNRLLGIPGSGERRAEQRVYVLESDITSTQRRVEIYQNKNKFG